jgi:hypothetical protein
MHSRAQHIHRATAIAILRPAMKMTRFLSVKEIPTIYLIVNTKWDRDFPPTKVIRRSPQRSSNESVRVYRATRNRAFVPKSSEPWDGTQRNSHIEAHFDSVHLGWSRDQVLQVMGRPSWIEPCGRSFGRHKDNCTALAVRDEMGPETRWVTCTWIFDLLVTKGDTIYA